MPQKYNHEGSPKRLDNFTHDELGVLRTALSGLSHDILSDDSFGTPAERLAASVAFRNATTLCIEVDLRLDPNAPVPPVSAVEEAIAAIAGTLPTAAPLAAAA